MQVISVWVHFFPEEIDFLDKEIYSLCVLYLCAYALCVYIYMYLCAHMCFLPCLCTLLCENDRFLILYTGNVFWVGSVTFHLVGIWSNVLLAK